MVGEKVDASRFPELSRYLGALPSGLSSYPEARSMGILLRSATSARYFHPSWKDLPKELVAALRAPPPATSWVPTVLTDAVFCVVADTFYPTREDVRDWSYDRTISLSRVPMYTTLTRVAKLDRFLAAAEKIHALFQRGTGLTIRTSAVGAEVRLSHPAHLHGELNHFSNEGVFESAFHAAGAKDATVELVESTPIGARYVARYGQP